MSRRRISASGIRSPSPSWRASSRRRWCWCSCFPPEAACRTPFDALTVRPKKKYDLVKISEIEPLLEDEGRMKNYSIFPDDENRRFAMYYVEVERDSNWESEPHLKGTTEYITVFRGEIEICVDEKRFLLGEGESMRFRADMIHAYRNPGKETAICYVVLFHM